MSNFAFRLEMTRDGKLVIRQEGTGRIYGMYRNYATALDAWLNYVKHGI